MGYNHNHCFTEDMENSNVGNDCGCNQNQFDGCGDFDEGHDDCGCTRREYLGKSVTETKYYREETKRFIAPQKSCCRGRCRCGC